MLPTLNDAQFWALIRTAVLGIAFILGTLGVVTYSEAKLTEIINHTAAVVTAIGSLATIGLTVWQGFKARRAKELAVDSVQADAQQTANVLAAAAPVAAVEAVALLPHVEQVVMTSQSAAANIPLSNVVGPSGA